MELWGRAKIWGKRLKSDEDVRCRREEWDSKTRRLRFYSNWEVQADKNIGREEREILTEHIDLKMVWVKGQVILDIIKRSFSSLFLILNTMHFLSVCIHHGT